MEKNRSLTALIRKGGMTVLAAVLAVLVLAGCQDPAAVPAETEPSATVQVTDPPETEPTEPPPTAPADGNPDDATCQGSYSVSNKEFLQNNKTVVATIDDDVLSNAQLQIYYRMAVNSYRAEQHEIAPDFDQPLDVQLCPIDDTDITWQQYFLQCALNSWRSYVAMDRLSENTVFATEEVYKPDQQKHAEYLNDRMPALKVLYGYNTKYEINELHQQYLDALPAYLDQLAVDYGFASLQELLNEFAGLGIMEEDLLSYADLANRGYMLLTALSYDIEPTAEDVESYFTQREEDYAQMGITRDSGYYVNLRHILVVPENAVVADDGSVTCEQADWDRCKQEANKLLQRWAKKRTWANFADLAFAKSADGGSSINGGLYSNVTKGQLTDALDAWCFDANRRSGDIDIVKSDCGYHVVYFDSKTEIWYKQAEADLIAEQLKMCIDFAKESNPMDVDYSAISLNEKEVSDLAISTYDVVYHDIAHERYMVVPLYLQQDYPDVMYGKYPLTRYGCGIATMAMLASYMTDEEWTPPEMAALYGSYCGPSGTAHALFNEVATDRGFFVEEKVYYWSDAQKALEEGKIVISLQDEGYWTKAGHYLLLHNLTEDGKLVVRDSNIGNYFTLPGHTLGYFETSTVPGASRCYWVYQKKVTRIPACARCGEEGENLPFAMFEQDYYCPKCQEAMHRRKVYIDVCAGR